MAFAWPPPPVGGGLAALPGGGAMLAPALPAAAGAADPGVTYACEFCRTKFATFDEADAHERACPMNPQSQAAAAAAAAHGRSPGAVALPPGAAALPLGAAALPPGFPGPAAMLGAFPGGAAGVFPGAFPGGAGLPLPGAPGAPHGPLPGMPAMALPLPGMPGALLPGLGAQGGAGGGAPPQLGRVSTVHAEPPGMEGVREALMEFRRRWHIELRFEPRILEHLRQQAGAWRTELARLGDELRDAGVPPVCRSGYLLVVMGQVTEAHTDEDIRNILCPNLGAAGCAAAGAAGAGGAGGAGAGAEAAAPGAGEAGDRASPAAPSAATAAPAAAPAAPAPAPADAEEWVVREVADMCARFKIEEPLRARFVKAMSSRTSTFKADMATLASVLKTAKHPPGVLSLKLREMQNGIFKARSLSPERGGGAGGAPPGAPPGASPGGGRRRSRSGGRRRQGRSRSRERRRRTGASRSKSGAGSED